VYAVDRVNVCFILTMYLTNCYRDENQKLPVPGDILSMFGGQNRPSVVDDPALHQGKIRSFAHERGNWASLVYISRMQIEYITIFYLICCDCICSRVVFVKHGFKLYCATYLLNSYKSTLPFMQFTVFYSY